MELSNKTELGNAIELSNWTLLNNTVELGPYGVLQPETIAFVERVEADGGTVEDVNFLNAFIVDAKNNGYFDDIVAAYSPSWGVKGTTTASDLYSVIGSGQDMLEAVGASQPSILATDLNNNTRLLFDGVDDKLLRVFPYADPKTIILAGAEQVTWTSGDRLFSAGDSGTSSFSQQVTLSPNIRQFSGVGGNEDANFSLTNSHHIRMLFNSANSKIQVGDNTETSSALNVSTGTGFTLAAHPSSANWGNIKVGSILLLDAAVDGSYTSKVAAIRSFFGNIYGV